MRGLMNIFSLGMDQLAATIAQHVGCLVTRIGGVTTECGSSQPSAPEQTEAAVVAFQQANGLAVDGRVGPETAAALNSALAGG